MPDKNISKLFLVMSIQGVEMECLQGSINTASRLFGTQLTMQGLNNSGQTLHDIITW